jgi:tripartite-type tricarboxylate transporter receptor subunit TctC
MGAWRIFLRVAGFALVAPLAAWSQAYPTKPIRMIVPFPPGPSADFVARMVGTRNGTALGQPFIFENRAGANGAIGTEIVARAAPDGYTLQIGTSSTHMASVFLTNTLPYDPFRDFTPIVALVDPTTCLAVTQSLPVTSVKELVEYARHNPGKLSYSSSGSGGFLHLAMEQLKQAAGLDIVHVPYKGAGPAVADLAAGRVETAVISLANARPLEKAGKVRMLAYMDRYSFVPPGAPVLAELVPGFEKLPAFFGFYGPAGLPRPIVRRLHAETIKVLQSPEVSAKLVELDFGILGGSTEEFAAMMKKGAQTYARVIKAAGIQAE